METPDILLEATRQFRHNYGDDELVCGFDNDETIEIVTQLQSKLANAKEALESSKKGLLWSIDNYQHGVKGGLVQLAKVIDEALKQIENEI